MEDMIILRQKYYSQLYIDQKEFTTPWTRFKAHTARFGRDISGILGYLGGTAKRAAETIGYNMRHPVSTSEAIVKGIKKDNVEALKGIKNGFYRYPKRDLNIVRLAEESGKHPEWKKAALEHLAKSTAEVATDFNPTTAGIKVISRKGNQILEKSGKDWVETLGDFKTNPIMKTGDELGYLRMSQLGADGFGGQALSRMNGKLSGMSKKLGGTWTKGGVNDACFGTAPDRVMYHFGDAYEKAHAAELEAERAQFKRKNKKLANRIQHKIDSINSFGDKVKSWFTGIGKSREKLQPGIA